MEDGCLLVPCLDLMMELESAEELAETDEPVLMESWVTSSLTLDPGARESEVPFLTGGQMHSFLS